MCSVQQSERWPVTLVVPAYLKTCDAAASSRPHVKMLILNWHVAAVLLHGACLCAASRWDVLFVVFYTCGMLRHSIFLLLQAMPRACLVHLKLHCMLLHAMCPCVSHAAGPDSEHVCAVQCCECTCCIMPYSNTSELCWCCVCCYQAASSHGILRTWQASPLCWRTVPGGVTGHPMQVPMNLILLLVVTNSITRVLLWFHIGSSGSSSLWLVQC
jgi:hypothetical protein